MVRQPVVRELKLVDPGFTTLDWTFNLAAGDNTIALPIPEYKFIATTEI